MVIESFKCARRSLECRSTIGPTVAGPGKNFQTKGP